MEEFNLVDIINQLSKTSVFEEYSIEDCRKQLKDVVEFFQSQSYFEEALHAVSVERNLPENALREYGCFFIPEDTTLMEIPEWMKNSSLGIVKSKYFPQKRGSSFPDNVLEFDKAKNENLHPAQKPEKLLEHIIKTYTETGDIVLDATMGSGSTGEACMNTSRKFIGFELNKEFYSKNEINEYFRNSTCWHH